MQGSEDNNWVGDYGVRVESESNGSEVESDSAVEQPAEVDRWQQYRRWISKAPAPCGRRKGVDPSLYTWKGYRNWTEQVKRNWFDS